MLTESEEKALTRIRFYLQAGHSVAAIRETGWEEWIVHFEKIGVSISVPESPLSPTPVNVEAEPAEGTDTPHRQPAMQDGTQDVVLDRVAAPATPSPDPKYAKTNAFAAIGFPALSSTADLRKASERAQIKLKMARDARPDPAVSSLERLVGDPKFRMREAAAWYFSVGTAEKAAANEPNSLSPHDAVLASWHSVLDELSRGAYDSDSFSAACEATAGLMANMAAWEPLQTLADEIGDVRLGPDTVSSAAEVAVERWTCEALFAVAATGNPSDTRSAAEIKAEGVDFGGDLVDEFGGGVDAAIEATILRRAPGSRCHPSPARSDPVRASYIVHHQPKSV